MAKNALVIGANGGIGNEVVKQLLNDQSIDTVFTVARGDLHGIEVASSRVQHQTMDTADESAVKDYVEQLKASNQKLSIVICTTGILHQTSDSGTPLKPEKRLEDMNTAQLAEYFRINSILPALWLQSLVKVVAKEKAVIAFLSARVGSISDNSLGGWYGYRASKAALNMLLKTASIEYKRRVPNTSLMCYHPGTVDTGLSKPFQANVKPEKLFTPAFTVGQLLSIVEGLDADQGPYYLDWDGKHIPW